MAGDGNRSQEKGYDINLNLGSCKSIPICSKYAEQQIGIDFDERIFIVRKDPTSTDKIKDLYSMQIAPELDPTYRRYCLYTLQSPKELFRRR